MRLRRTVRGGHERRRAARVLSGVIGKRPPSTAQRWNTYLRTVEPGVAAQPRVHRCAQVPLIGEPSAVPVPVAVWIDGDGTAAARSRDSLAAGSVAPAHVDSGPLAEYLARTRCQHVVLLRAGDVLAPLALERLGQAVALAGDAAVITCDDDRLDAGGRRHAPRFRPGPSPDRWLACDDSGPLLAVRRDRAAALMAHTTGGPAWRHELAVSLAGAAADGHAHVPMLLCHQGPERPDPPALEPAELQRLIERWEPSARVERAGEVRHIRRSYPGEPAVEVFVCLRDKPELLARCAESLLGLTDYESITLALVDNGSREPETLALLDTLAGHPRVRVLRDERPFNFAALNNAAVHTSAADVVVFLNNDTEIVESSWVEPLLEEALRPGVGAVAPMLLYPDGTVQHAGAAVGLHGYAGHPFAGLKPGTETPFGRADGGTRNWLAVTAACMMVERTKFMSVGGFDESFIVAGNDVDLCLRLTAAGCRSVCVPHAAVLHDESASRGAHIDPADFVRSEQSYGAFRTVGDPFYNPNLTLARTDCAVRIPGEGPG